MNASVLVPLLLVLVSGGLISLQAPTNAMLAKAGGSPALAALISFGIGFITLIPLWLASANRPQAVNGHDRNGRKTDISRAFGNTHTF